MNRLQSAARLFLGGIGFVSVGALLPPAAALAAPPPQLSQEDAALVKLNAGRRAFNEKNYPVAATSFKEFLASNGNHREAAGAWYGLGLCLLQTNQPDLVAATDAFTRAAAVADFPDRALAQYYLGHTLRAVGNRAMADAIARPNEADSLHKAALQRYTEAEAQFSAAQKSFDSRNKETPAPAPAALPLDVEWSARARCDAAEMLLRQGKYKEALDASAPFQADPILIRSKYRQLGLYHLGYAQFVLREYLAAGRSLSQLAPFAQDFGLHARYLLARVHHLSDERPEAAALYKALQDDFEVRRKAADKEMQNPATDAEHRAELEKIVHGPVPDYVSRSQFYGAVLLYEDGKYSDAADVFAKILQVAGNSPAAPEARLRLGYCQLQLKKFGDAVATLDPLKDNKEFGDRALWWGARAKVGFADPNNAQVYQAAVALAIDMLHRAAQQAQNISATDPDAKSRRADILLDLGDMQQLAKQFKEAATTYQQVAGEYPKSDRAEEAMQRKVTALHLGGQFAESDAAGDQFIQAYPKSTLMPAVLFRQAENSYLVALAAADGATPRPREEQEKLFNAAITRYQKLVSKYPDFEYADLARQALGTCYARVNDYAKAIAVLQTIPETSRTGDLALVPYLLADCEIRTLAPEADDALAAERLIETAEDAAKYLDAFINAQPKAPQTPDAMLKLGYCYQRIAEQIAAPVERTKMLTKAQEIYDRSTQQFGGDPSQAAVAFERAKVLAAMNNVGAAQAELSKFLNAPYHATPNAPLAIVRLSALYRATNRAPEAIELMKRCRDEFEKPLAADPARAPWIAMLRYEHGLAFQDAHKLPEARAIFEDIIKQFPASPSAINAQWRLAQCRRQEASENLAEARAVAERPGVNPTEVANAYAKSDELIKLLSQATETLRTQADAQAVAAANAEPTLRMMYELAWCYRVQGDAEADAVKLKMQHDDVEKVRAGWPKDQPPLPAVLGAPQIAAADIPLQPSQQKSLDAYQRVIFAGPATALASQARFEMAELLSQRGEIDKALDLLATALENQPPKDLTERIKVCVAAALLAKNNAESAMVQLRPILAEKETPVAAEARYLAGEASIRQQDWPKAIEMLLPFRDQDPFRNAAGIADRAVLRLGYAYAQAKQWEPSRVSYEALLNRFPQSEWINEARFGMGWAMQNQGRFDDAVNIYNDLRNRTAAEPAARALLNIGVCRLEQKRVEEALKSLMAVPLTYNYPDCTAAAMYHAGRAQVENKQPQEAKKLWSKVTKDYAATSWAPLAQQKLAEMK
ncbi:MAG TPA: tetratricopeptide repeat protein [Tepidisphaeraceae bacterium]|jgi:TolA-binding protein|nr:tetratricopeptide repeat protein [Tepidisphaeraceae bacterium]